MLKLHLGCGKRYIPEFIHIDQADFKHIDHCHTISTLPFIESETVDLIYSSHTLEYFDRIEVLEVLREWNRVLIPGGTLRVAVPDFEALIQVYQSSKDLNKVLGPLFGKMEIQNEKSFKIYHKTVYDFNSLRDVLGQCGYEKISHYDWRQTLHKDYDDHSQAYFPHMDKENGLLISLNVEAKKKL